MGEVRYSINGKYFKDYGIYVSSSLGLLDALKRKPIKTYDWPEYHGESLDLSNPKFEAREIVLNCFIKGDNYQEMFDNFRNVVLSEFQKSGTQRLLVEPFGYKALPFEVYLSDEVKIAKEFSESISIGVFSIKLIEPNPIKKVLYLTENTLNLSYNSSKETEIFFVNGEKTTAKGNVSLSGKTLANRNVSSNNFVGRNLLAGSDLKNQFTGTAFTVDGISYNTYCDGYAFYNDGLPNPSTIYHSYINNTTFGFPVVVYNESNGTRNWKGGYKVVNGQINSHGDFVISFDVYATGLGTKIFGGFLYAKKGDTVANFHSGQFNIEVNKVNEWHRVTATCKLNDDVDLTKEVRFYCYGYGFSTNSILYVRKYKLESGNKATDWTPAPEDEKYIIIAGDVDGITNLTTNATVLWEKL